VQLNKSKIWGNIKDKEIKNVFIKTYGYGNCSRIIYSIVFWQRMTWFKIK
jgi:hypothetical protein